MPVTNLTPGFDPYTGNRFPGGSTSDSGGHNETQATGGGDNYNRSIFMDQYPQLDFLERFGNMSGELANSQYDWARNEFANNTNLTNRNIGDYLSGAGNMLDQGYGDLSEYNRYNPGALADLDRDAASYASPERVQAEMGRAEAETAQNFQSQRNNLMQELQGLGVDPSSGRFAGQLNAMASQQAAAQAGAGTQARNATEATGRGLRSEELQTLARLPGQAATLTNVGYQGLTGAQNAGMGNTSLGALILGTTPNYLNSGIQNVKFAPLGNEGYGHTFNNSSGFGDQWSHSESAGPGAPVPQSQSQSIPNFHPPTMVGSFARGGGVYDTDEQTPGVIPPEYSPSGGAKTDDVTAKVNVGEFVIPQDVTAWLGQKYLQDTILKARKAMADGSQAPAQPTMGPQDDGVAAQRGGAIPHFATGGYNDDGHDYTYTSSPVSQAGYDGTGGPMAPPATNVGVPPVDASWTSSPTSTQDASFTSSPTSAMPPADASFTSSPTSAIPNAYVPPPDLNNGPTQSYTSRPDTAIPPGQQYYRGYNPGASNGMRNGFMTTNRRGSRDSGGYYAPWDADSSSWDPRSGSGQRQGAPGWMGNRGQDGFQSGGFRTQGFGDYRGNRGYNPYRRWDAGPGMGQRPLQSWNHDPYYGPGQGGGLGWQDVHMPIGGNKNPGVAYTSRPDTPVTPVTPATPKKVWLGAGMTGYWADEDKVPQGAAKQPDGYYETAAS
jgi:hypothetical protein